MSSWDFLSIGFTNGKKDELIKKLLECLGVDFDERYSSQTGEISSAFSPDYIGDLAYYYEPIQIYGLLNKIFGQTFLYYEAEEGNDTNDYYSRYEEIYDPINNEINVGETDYCYDGDTVFGESVYDLIKEECEEAAKKQNIPIEWGEYYPEGEEFYWLCKGILDDNGGLSGLGTREETKTLDEVDKIKIETDIIDKILSTAKEKGYDDIEKIVTEVIIEGKKSAFK